MLNGVIDVSSTTPSILFERYTLINVHEISKTLKNDKRYSLLYYSSNIDQEHDHFKIIYF